MALQDKNQESTIPAPVASVRPEGYKVGDEVTMYGKTFKVVGTRPNGGPILDLQNAPQMATKVNKATSVGSKQKNTQAPRRGLWIHNKLNSLYNDNTYKRATPEVQKLYKSQAYDKWVVPYFKHIGVPAISKEKFLGEPEHLPSFSERAKGLFPSKDEYLQEQATKGLSILKETSKITAGLLDDFGWINKNIFDPLTPDINKGGSSVFEKASQFMQEKQQFYEQQLQDLTGKEELSWRHDLSSKLSEVAVDQVFFEATGAGKVAQLFRISNPKTAGVAVQLAKSAWNEAVTFGAWEASQGENVENIGKAAGAGAVLGPAGKLVMMPLKSAFTGLMSAMFKFGGSNTANTVFQAGVKKAAGLPTELSDKELPKFSDLTKKAVDRISLYLDQTSKDRYKKSFKDIPWIKQRALVNEVFRTDVMSAAKQAAGNPPPELLHTYIQEQQEKLNQVTPQIDRMPGKASQVEQKVNEFVQKNTGKNPSVVKIHATMPHHNTDETSSVSQIAARISFLRNKLVQGGTNEEKAEIIKAIKEEKGLLDKVKSKAKSKGTVGGASLNDSRFFKGEDFILRPSASLGDPGYFADWSKDKEAGELVKQIAAQSPVGMMDRRVQNIMTSFQAGNMLAQFARDNFQETRLMFHSQYGNIGGINFSVIGEGEHKTLMLNWIALRPNIVARAYDVPGAGQTLLLQVLDMAKANNAGLDFHAAPSAVKFYQKVLETTGDENHDFKLSAGQVRSILEKKGILMMLIGAGITFGATKDQLSNDTQVRMR